MTEKGFVACLSAVLADDEQSSAVFDPDCVRDVATFDEAGLLTGNHGLVVRLADGGEYQVTIVQSRPSRVRRERQDDAR